MRYEDQTFENQAITLDGNEFINCRFLNCTFTYAGGDWALDGSQFTPLDLDLEGPALRTKLLLDMLQRKAILMGSARIETGDAVFERVLRKDV